jgi:hypothetical protein
MEQELEDSYDVLSGTYHHMQDIFSVTAGEFAADLKNLEFVEHDLLDSIDIAAAITKLEARTLLEGDFILQKVRRYGANLINRRIWDKLNEDYRRLKALVDQFEGDLSLGILTSVIFMVGMLLYAVIQGR